MSVCKFFAKVGRKVLWEDADPRELITCAADRQAKYACLIKHVKFFEQRAMWPAPVLSCPQLPNIQSLQIDNISLFASNSQQLRLFLSSELRELCIWTAPGQAHQVSDPRGDITWLSRLGATCVKLEVLQLEVALDVSAAELTSFFDSMMQLKTICLGSAFDDLDQDTLTAILTLPKLEHLSLDTAFLTELLATRKSSEILPRATRLALRFLDSEGLAPAILPTPMITLEHLRITLASATPMPITSLNPALLPMLRDLHWLQSFSLVLSTKTIVSIADLLSVASLTHLAYSSDYHQTASSSQRQSRFCLLRKI